MKRSRPIIGLAILLVLGIAIGVILAGGDADSPLSLASIAHAQKAESDATGTGGSATPTAGPIIDLPATARQEIEKYLGKGVVGRAIEAPIIDDPATFMGLNEQQMLRVNVVHGEMAGKTRDITISRLDRRDPQPAWRLDTGDEVWFGEIDASGDFVQNAVKPGITSV